MVNTANFTDAFGFVFRTVITTVFMVNTGHSFLTEGIGTWLQVTSISDFTPVVFLMVFLGWLFEAIIVVVVI